MAIEVPLRPGTVVKAIKALECAGCSFPAYYIRHMARRPSFGRWLADEYDKRIKNGTWKVKP